MLIASWKEVLDFWFNPENIPLHFQENVDLRRVYTQAELQYLKEKNGNFYG